MDFEYYKNHLKKFAKVCNICENAVNITNDVLWVIWGRGQLKMEN
jgi:hypothetical protein